MKEYILLLCILSLNACSDRLKIEKEDVDKAFNKTSLPFSVLGVSIDENSPVFYSYGQADPDAIFEIASMTKAITSTAVMQLVEQEKIDLDTPIENYLPEINQIEILNKDLTTQPRSNPITMRHLLTHTSGFAYSFNSMRIMEDLGISLGDWPQPEIVAEGVYDWGFNGPQPRQIFEAGERWHYGRNLGIAGRVIERVSGLDLDTYFKEHIFIPLGMNRSGYNLPEDIISSLLPMSMRDPITGDFTLMPSIRPVPMNSFYGGGDLLSTPKDYTRFLQCLVNGGEIDGVRILSNNSVELFFSNQLPEDMTLKHPLTEFIDRPANSPQRTVFDDKDTHSLAWTIEANPNERGNRPQGVGAWSGIFNTYYTVDNDRGVVVVAFMQLFPFNDGEAYELYREFEDLVYHSLDK